jgi:phage terminase Nu1 subunit (DNA packaging protein)
MGRAPHTDQPEEWINKTELARIFGKTTRQLDNYHDEGMPDNGESGAKRRFPLNACREWFTKYQLDVMMRERGNVDGDTAKALKTHYEAELKRMDLLERQGMTTTVIDATDMMERKLVSIRNRFTSVPTIYAPRLTNIPTAAEMMQKLSDMLNDVWSSIVAEQGNASDTNSDDTE